MAETLAPHHAKKIDWLQAKEDPLKFYEKFADDYEEAVKGDGYDTPERCAFELFHALPSMTEKQTPLRILDIGAGTGLQAKAFFALTDKPSEFEWTAADASKNILDLAWRTGLYKASHQMDCNSLAMFKDDEFDGLICVGTCVYLDAKKALPEMVRLVKPGGSLVLSYDGSVKQKWIDMQNQLEQDGKIMVIKHMPDLEYLPANHVIYQAKEKVDIVVMHRAPPVPTLSQFHSLA